MKYQQNSAGQSTSRSEKKSSSIILNTIDVPFQFISEKNIQNDPKPKAARPYLMIQPKLVEEFDQNNQKSLKVSFQNSITDLQTIEEPKKEIREKSGSVQFTPKSQKRQGVSQFCRHSARHLTQL